MKKLSLFLPAAISGILFLFATLSHGDESHRTVADLQTSWDVTNFQLKEKAQLEAFEKLQAQAQQYTEEHPDDADGWIWSGIIKSSYAGAKGGLGALGLAKKARKDLETAINLNGQAMHGSAYTSLGTLYFNLPGWPISFGSDKKAEQMLQKGLEIDPEGMDSNFFFAEFLRNQGEPTKARVLYLKARAAGPRPGRSVAEQGRREEIDATLAALGTN